MFLFAPKRPFPNKINKYRSVHETGIGRCFWILQGRRGGDYGDGGSYTATIAGFRSKPQQLQIISPVIYSRTRVEGWVVVEGAGLLKVTAEGGWEDSGDNNTE